MASSHSIGLSGVGNESFFASRLWLPRGWATQAFIVLSGISAAVVLNWAGGYDKIEEKLRRKAGRLLIVMFLSNVFFLVVSYSVQGRLSLLREPSWWTGLLTLSTPYSISGILLPVAVMLIVTPYLYRAGERWGWVAAGLTVWSFAILIGLVRSAVPTGASIRHIVEFGAGFPVLPMVVQGALGFTAGMLWRSSIRNWVLEKSPRTLFVSAFLLVVLLNLNLRVWNQIKPSLAPLSRTLLLFIFGAACMALPLMLKFVHIVKMLGRYPLLCFLAHRIVIQATLLTLRLLRLGNPTLRYGICLSSVIGILGTACGLRSRYGFLERACKAVYL
ncbi:MAG: hypothetical protein ACM3JB_01580 [Acidobacteriaceae bacterium]